jgi:hypothetical protein
LPPLPWLAPLAAAAAARWWLARAHTQRQRSVPLFIAATVAIWAAADALRLARGWDRPLDLVSSFPVLLFLLFLPPLRSVGASTAHAELVEARRALSMMLAVAAVFTAAICFAGTFNPELRHPQWGPRFLLAMLPLLAAAIAFACEHRHEWVRLRSWPRRLPSAVLALLVLASVAVQTQGIRDLRNSKQQYEHLVTAVEAVDPDAVIVTDVWWFAAMCATVLYAREAVAVDVPGAEPLRALLPLLNDKAVRALTLVTAAPPADERTRALANAGWVETERRTVALWMNVALVSYRRPGGQPDSGSGTLETSLGDGGCAPHARRGRAAGAAGLLGDSASS